MNVKTKAMRIPQRGETVFAGPEFAPTEVAALQAEATRIISEKMAIRESLMTELAEWIDEKSLKQEDASQILGVSRPRVSDLINKKYRKFKIDALIAMLSRTGKRVRLTSAIPR